MSLPSPIPDNPTRWDGWRFYNSENYYERLCLSFDSNPSDHQIEDHCRQLLVWWQKKLPLKNQPSNPMAQLLRTGLDEAPQCLVEARTDLLNPETRTKIDDFLRGRMREHAIAELDKYLVFSIRDGMLGREDELYLYQVGVTSGLKEEDISAVIESELEKRGAKRKPVEEPPAPPPVLAQSAGPAMALARPDNPADEFRRVLRLSGLDGDLTDDQRDALCNMGENLGLTGGQAEDLIDEYIDELDGVSPMRAPSQQDNAMAAPAARKPPVPVRSSAPATPVAGAKKKEAAPSRPGVAVTPALNPVEIAARFSPLTRAQEKAKYPTFQNHLGMEMLLIPSGSFFMGGTDREAAPNEKPVAQVTQTCFYIARHPVTNWQYEKFDPSHASKRMPTADDKHPVVYVNSLEAIKFCEWLSARERKKYRLPTEAEWEYAARGADGRCYPWGERLDAGHYANFADRNTNFTWRDPDIDDGYAETSPVGAYPRGNSPFGIEDMAGNVWEWCFDFFETYKEKPRLNPKGGPASSGKRIYRGGSWKSRPASLRATTRNFNMPTYSSNDVGFRIVCECE